MAIWCQHNICIGFHKISKAEGRNDVFSTLKKHLRWLYTILLVSSVEIRCPESLNSPKIPAL